MIPPSVCLSICFKCHLFSIAGLPPHVLYDMNGFWPNNTKYINYKPYHIQRDPLAEVQPKLGYPFIPGKDMNALQLNGATVQIIQAKRNEECYNNLGELLKICMDALQTLLLVIAAMENFLLNIAAVESFLTRHSSLIWQQVMII